MNYLWFIQLSFPESYNVNYPVHKLKETPWTTLGHDKNSGVPKNWCELVFSSALLMELAAKVGFATDASEERSSGGGAYPFAKKNRERFFA